MTAIAFAVLVSLAQAKGFQHTAPAHAKAGEVLLLEGSLTGTAQYSELVVLFRGPGEDYAEAKMELQYGDLYRGAVPAARMVPPGIEYYVEGRTKGGERVALFMTARKPARVNVLTADGLLPPEPPEPRPERFPKAEKFQHPEEKPAAEAPPPPPARAEAPAPAKATALEQELQVYRASYQPGLGVKLEDTVRNTPQAWLIVTAAQMRAMGARHVYEVLDSLPGFAVSRDVQGFYRAAVRGIRGDAEILYLLDGQKLNAFYDGKALAALPVDNLLQIEVLRGPGPVNLPAGDFTAVVNLVTDRKDGLRGAVQAGLNAVYSAPPVNPQAPTAPGANVADRGSLQGHVSGAQRFDMGLSVFLDADVLKDNGYSKPIVQDGLKLYTPAGYTEDKRVLVNVGGGARYHNPALGDLWVQARVIDEWRTALVGQFDVTANTDPLRWQALLFDLGLDRRVGTHAVLKSRAWFGQQSIDREFHQTPPGFPNAMFQAEGLVEELKVGERSFGLQIACDVELPANNNLTVGVRGEFRSLYEAAYLVNFEGPRNDQASAERHLAGDVVGPLERGDGAAARRLGIGVFLLDTWRPTQRITVQGGVRLDLFQLPTVNTAALVPDIDGSALALAVSPRLSAVLAPTDDLALKVGYGRSFRAPTVEELALELPNTPNNQGRFVGNPALSPGYLDAVELSLEYLFGLGEAKARVRAAGFYDRFTNPIVPVDTTGNLYALKNRPDGVQAFGAELEARLEVTPRGGAWFNASWVRAQDLGTVPTAWLITEVPQLRFNAGLSVPLGPYLTADVFARVHSERRNDARSVLELLRRYRLPAYALVGAQLRTEALFEHVELSFSVHNLFDTDYADDAPRPDRITFGVPREGLSGMLGARLFL